MEIKKLHWMGISIALAIAMSSILLINTKFFFISVGFSIVVGVTPFVLTLMQESREAVEKEGIEMVMDVVQFVRWRWLQSAAMELLKLEKIVTMVQAMEIIKPVVRVAKIHSAVMA